MKVKKETEAQRRERNEETNNIIAKQAKLAGEESLRKLEKQIADMQKDVTKTVAVQRKTVKTNNARLDKIAKQLAKGKSK